MKMIFNIWNKNYSFSIRRVKIKIFEDNLTGRIVIRNNKLEFIPYHIPNIEIEKIQKIDENLIKNLKFFGITCFTLYIP